ncbi:hypothetical protein [Halobacteriovorax marinus]|uniref:hypothetical protein n=1 Tax=Halobacteriovorax marinus TaxID=97084 RepID=UPI003A8FB7FB
MKIIIFYLCFLFSFNSLSASTGEILYFNYSEYYQDAPYEVNYCHKNHAKLLRYLKKKGADLAEIKVLIIQQDRTRTRLEPQNGRFDNSYAWHVVLLHDGIIYDLNAAYSEEGIELADYFSYALGYDTLDSDILLRVYEGDFFFSYFYYPDGRERIYNPGDFVKKFLSTEALSPLIQASMLKWF